ncbi:MAG: thioredoxin domain-containing protein [Bacteroidota bacterium]
MQNKHTNALIHETSPYLLQHAHNPVDWYPWNAETLAKAVSENKPILISIGYAACHWCHVMEHECFEDEEVAHIMNEGFINIKIDREERPDVDQIYMDAIQLMSGHGGWPLNIVALPDGRPFWGATYVPKEKWMNLLSQLQNVYHKEPKKVQEYAANLTRGISAVNDLTETEKTTGFNLEALKQSIASWAQAFDTFLGGYKRAPKFMMPNNWDFLLHYAHRVEDSELLEHVNTTLRRMAYGGIFDHVGGGFSRYAVDTKWHVPHFEKMLYDNAQLVSLYSKAYALTKNKLYKKTVQETINFVLEELQSPDGGFYASLDADSLNKDGILHEGAFYVWEKDELESHLKDDYDVFQSYFNINSYGLWEEDNSYVLIRDKSKDEVAAQFDIAISELEERIQNSLNILKQERETRSRPRLDDKILCSWNALMLNGFVDAFRYLEEPKYLRLALDTATFIKDKLFTEAGGLYRNHKAGKSTIHGFLEDYATVIEAFINLYQVTFDETWLLTAKALLTFSQKHFYDAVTGMFYFTADFDEKLIRRTIETGDNVISASNSIMAKNLFFFHKLYPQEVYGTLVDLMLETIAPTLEKYPSSHANWLNLILYRDTPFYEIVVTGKNYQKVALEFISQYLPHMILAASAEEGGLPIQQQKHVSDKTLIYVCQSGACSLPVESIESAQEQLF